MNKNHNTDSIRKKFSDITALAKVCVKFDFPSNYFPVFVSLHCCGAEHFQNPGLPESVVEEILHRVDISTPETLTHSLLAIPHEGIRNALVTMCSTELLKLVFPGMEAVFPELSISQMDDLGFLYLREGYRDEMTLLYTYFVKPFLRDFQQQSQKNSPGTEKVRIRKPRRHKKKHNPGQRFDNPQDHLE